MHSKLINHPQNTFVNNSSPESMQLTCDKKLEETLFTFEVSFQGQMDMHSDIDTVAEYLNAHDVWFERCAQPMKVEPINENGYILTVGKYGSFGYEVEPKVGVILQPPVDRVYLMHTIPLPEEEAAGYEVIYNASMKLQEKAIDPTPASNHNNGLFSKRQVFPSVVTQVMWDLDLKVKVKFPRFITKLSHSLIQGTGDRLLGQIVRQVSPRLTYKVQQDFHNSYHLAMPPHSSRQLHKVTKTQSYPA
ncbi:MAG: DUF1997 domain-containing protein [Cyanobacteria bacterium P01_A01_bin.83]